MQQMYQVFIYQSSITFQQPIDSKNQLSNKIYVQLNHISESIKIIKWLKSQDFKVDIVFQIKNLAIFWQQFKNQFKLVNAAGGVVENKNRELLFIFRNGKWDLPKGKIEIAEEINKAALREVEEECGIKNLQIINELPNTYHIYWQDETMVLKPTFWYKMKTDFEGKLKPQTEEGIEKVEWLNPTDLEKVYNNTYASISSLMKAILSD